MGKRIPLQIDHIDGVRNNCLRENLRFLCPTCHALTPTFAGRNRKNSRPAVSDQEVLEAYDQFLSERLRVPSLNELHTALGYSGPIRNKQQRMRLVRVLGDEHPFAKAAPRSSNKQKIEWPANHVLETLLQVRSRLAVANMLGVSDTAVKKHCAKHGIAEPTCRRSRPRSAASTAPDSTAPQPSRRERSMSRLNTLHGTRKGYLLEARLGLHHCDPCRKANTEYSTQLRLRTAG